MDLKELLIRAKEGDVNAKEVIIEKYYPLIIKESKKIFLKDYSFEDIVQIGVVNLLNAINKFDINRGEKSFSSYALWAVKNGYSYLCRSEIRYNDEQSLNFVMSDGFEFVDTLMDDKDIERDFFINLRNNILYEALDTLDSEERALIDFLYFSDKKGTLTKYSAAMNKDYYYCTVLKKRVFKKLKMFLKDLMKDYS